MTPPKVLIAGIGNIFLGDDGFGCVVAERLARRPLPDWVQVIDFGIRGFDLAYALMDGCGAPRFSDRGKQAWMPACPGFSKEEAGNDEIQHKCLPLRHWPQEEVRSSALEDSRRRGAGRRRGRSDQNAS
jgi:hypothetical protein